MKLAFMLGGVLLTPFVMLAAGVFCAGVAGVAMLRAIFGEADA